MRRGERRSRRYLMPAVVATLIPALLAVGGCSVNPATGEWAFTAFMSEEEEIEVGRREHPKILDRFGGAYEDPALQGYIGGIGMAIARHAELPNHAFSFTVLNSETVNAFALPGGYVYITRGLLALAGDEAEVAGVIAHEIGHIAARHTAERYSHTVVASAWVGAMSALGVDTLTDFAEEEADLYLKDYSRDQESEADLLAVRYMTAAGYDAEAVASFLARLERYDTLIAALYDKQSRRSDSFAATHPRTLERIERATEIARAEADGVAAARDQIGDYLRRIDGMLYGSDPALGFVRGRLYAHPGLGIRFEVPEGFRVLNGRSRAVAKSPEGSLILFDLARKPAPGGLIEYLEKEWAPSLSLELIERLDVNGFEGATGVARVDTNVGPRDLRLVALRQPAGRIFRFMFLTRPEATEATSESLRHTTYSFRPLAAEEAAGLTPRRLRLAAVAPGDTVESLARRMPFEDLAVERFQVLNGLDPDDGLAVGRVVKLVRE